MESTASARLLRGGRVGAHGDRQPATASSKVDIVTVPSIPGNSPLQAHLLVGNEKLITQKTVDWLKSVGILPAARQ